MTDRFLPRRRGVDGVEREVATSMSFLLEGRVMRRAPFSASRRT